MGGSGGIAISAEILARIKEATDSRLRALADNSTRFLFAVEDVDRSSLQSHLIHSKVFLQE